MKKPTVSMSYTEASNTEFNCKLLEKDTLVIYRGKHRVATLSRDELHKYGTHTDGKAWEELVYLTCNAPALLHAISVLLTDRGLTTSAGRIWIKEHAAELIDQLL